MRKCIFPGTFDPFTRGHLDLVRRAARQLDEVIVAVSDDRKGCAYPLETRVAMAREATKGLDGVTVRAFSGMLVELCREEGVYTVLRGLRNAQDLAYEQSLTYVYRTQDERIETMYLLTDPAYAHVEARYVRELAANGCDVTAFVTDGVARIMKDAT